MIDEEDLDGAEDEDALLDGDEDDDEVLDDDLDSSIPPEEDDTF